MRANLPGLLAALVVLFPACSPPVAENPGQLEQAPREATSVPGCPGAIGARHARSQTTHGDVDGDGRPDRIYVAVDRSAEPGCRALVVVQSRGRLQAASLDDAVISFELGLPRLNSLASIDSEPGLEIVVDVAQGASTSFVGVVTLSDGRPALVRSARLAGIAEGLFAHGGSVGHLDAVDCRSGLVMVSSAVAGARRYRVIRRFLDPQGSRWPLRPSLTERRAVRPEQIGRFEEFSAPPFASC